MWGRLRGRHRRLCVGLGRDRLGPDSVLVRRSLSDASDLAFYAATRRRAGRYAPDTVPVNRPRPGTANTPAFLQVHWLRAQRRTLVGSSWPVEAGVALPLEVGSPGVTVCVARAGMSSWSTGPRRTWGRRNSQRLRSGLRLQPAEDFLGSLAGGIPGTVSPSRRQDRGRGLRAVPVTAVIAGARRVAPAAPTCG